jgi:hypothetical protein
MAEVAIAYMIAREFSSTALSLTLSKISGIIFEMGNHKDDLVQKVHIDLQIIPIEKLKIINAISEDFKSIRIKSKTIDKLLKMINETASKIYQEMRVIQQAQFDYEASWFRSFRSNLFVVQPELNKIRALSIHLNNTFKLLTSLLPCCVTAISMSVANPSKEEKEKLDKDTTTTVAVLEPEDREYEVPGDEIEDQDEKKDQHQEKEKDKEKEDSSENHDSTKANTTVLQNNHLIDDWLSTINTNTSTNLNKENYCNSHECIIES